MRLTRFRLSFCNLFLQAAVVHAQTPNRTEVYDPVEDPKAIVTVGHARFTILTPQMIRLEWSADGKFEDHASLVFLERHLPVPQFSTTKLGDGIEIRTSALDLKYSPVGPGKFDAQNLSVSLTLPSGTVTWHPGDREDGNLMGTTRTLDGALGGKTGRGVLAERLSAAIGGASPLPHAAVASPDCLHRCRGLGRFVEVFVEDVCHVKRSFS